MIYIGGSYAFRQDVKESQANQVHDLLQDFGHWLHYWPVVYVVLTSSSVHVLQLLLPQDAPLLPLQLPVVAQVSLMIRLLSLPSLAQSCHSPHCGHHAPTLAAFAGNLLALALVVVQRTTGARPFWPHGQDVLRAERLLESIPGHDRSPQDIRCM